MTLPAAFLERPFAHRALHDRAAGRVENSVASIKAAIAQGYGIEIDVQCAADTVAMVFHDYDLGRLTDQTGAVGQRTSAELAQVGLSDDPGTIPTLSEVLDLVAGRVPLLIEIKDQSGVMSADIGGLGAAIASDLAGYAGPVALMSFNPHHIAEMARLCPDLPRGLVTDPYQHGDWPTVPPEACAALREIGDFDRVAASFISHKVDDLSAPRVAALRAGGASILCWTVRSAAQEAEARKVAHNITFEGYLA